VTDQKRAEEQLAQAQKMEAVGQLTGGLAHDFNNYLGVIIGNLDLLQETGDIAPEQKKLVDASLNSALRATELTQQLLAFSRRQPLDPRRIDVNQNLNAIIGLLQPTLGETIVLKTELAPDIWPVTLDSAQLDSCIVNLATNAHDAMPDGGNLTINTRNAQLDEQYAETNPDTAPGDYVLIEVSDTGAGMPPDTVAQVFEPFFTTKDVGKGSGLGLSMVFGFVKQSGGHVKIYSEVGHGTVVRLYLPRADEDEDEDEANDAVASVAPTQNSVPTGTEIILVVEDNEPVRQTAVKQLTWLGYRTVEATNGAAAQAILDQHEKHLDLLFSDVVMPGKPGGYELVEIALERRPGIKTLLTSGFPGDTLNRKGTDTTKLLGKPYLLEELAQAVRSVLDSETSNPGELT
jgi:nitrogen-specific signal transduction histidine kinase